MKIAISKEWCMATASREDGGEISAGLLHPGRAIFSGNVRFSSDPAIIAKAVELAVGRVAGNVMVAYRHRPWDLKGERRSRRHLKIFQDAGGPYVRIGRRTSQHKRYLKNMAAVRVVDADLRIVIFYESE